MATTPDRRSDRWQAVDWRAAVHDVTVLGRRMRVASLGSGETLPLLLVHGTGGCWQHWLRNLPGLAETRRVHAVDLPGFGASESPAGPASVVGYAQTVVALADELGLERFDVAGHSLGGLVATEVALRESHRLRRLVLVGGTATTILALARSPLRAGIRNPRTATAVAAEVMLGLRPVAAPLARATAARRRLRTIALWYVVRSPDALPPAFVAELVRGVGAEGFVPAVRAQMAYAHIGDHYRPITQPTFAVVGAHDRITPPSELEVLARRAARLSTLVLDEAGHLAMAEQPDRFDAAVESFLGAPATQLAV